MRALRPIFTARTAGLFYLLTFIAGFYALASGPGRAVADVVSTLSYVVVTLLFYALFRPVNRGISLVAAAVSLFGCVVSLLNQIPAVAFNVNPLAIFGCYCLLIGYLIINSQFMPKIIGILMAIGGVGWLTFASASIARRLSPYNFAPGILGEGVLTLWLLIAGVNEQRWNEQASLARNLR